MAYHPAFVHYTRDRSHRFTPWNIIIRFRKRKEKQ